MLRAINIFVFFLISLILLKPVFSADIPIIVIAPSQKAQSKSTVGTSVDVFDKYDIEKSNDFFLGNILNKGATSLNFFQTGGNGGTSGIQLRGFPKRYSTVFIDGVKQSDPGNVSGDFDFAHILKNQISRVEILKGNQSSVYGSGAIGGTINVTTKRGQPGFQREINYNTASNDTHNLALSMSGADDKNDFYIGLERFITAGISAMDDNDEDDGYKNNTLTANYGYKFNNKLKIENNLRIVDSYLQYDTKAPKDHSREDGDEEYRDEISASVSLIYKPNKKFTNRLIYSNYGIERTYNEYNSSQDDYNGYRKALTYSGNYNFDLDSSIVFGVDTEFDEIDYNQNLSNPNRVEGFQKNSVYVDYQKRFTNNLYATAGARIDDHSLVGKEDAQRLTLAYLFDDKTTKLKSSYGTGFRFPSLYESYYVWGSSPEIRNGLKAETSRGFDMGFEKKFANLGLDIDLTYFNTKYYDALEGWEDNDNGNSATMNVDGTSKAQGLELISKWKANKKLNFDLNYTYNSTYDGAEHDNPKLLASYTNSQMVRVPRHMFNLATNYIFPDENLNLTLHTKVSSKARDYGIKIEPANGSFDDVHLNSYMVNDLSLNYNLWNRYSIFFNVNNILDKKYYTSIRYSQMDRSVNFGIKRSY